MNCAGPEAALPLTVILPIYHGSSTAEVERAVQSLLLQTKPAEELLIVLDGPVADDLDSLVSTLESVEPSVRLVRLAENGGTAAAMRAGLAAASHRWVARQDGDDVSLPHRFETMWPVVMSNGFGAIGAAMLEFANNDPNDIVRVRRLPASPQELARYVKTNSPINNPTVILDADAVAEVGGVHDVHLMEDYDLFARLIAAGYQLTNLEEPVVAFNAADAMFKRRTGKAMARAEWQMQQRLVRYGLIGKLRAIANFVARQGFRALPSPLLKLVYRILFDRRTAKDLV